MLVYHTRDLLLCLSFIPLSCDSWEAEAICRQNVHCCHGPQIFHLSRYLPTSTAEGHCTSTRAKKKLFIPRWVWGQRSHHTASELCLAAFGEQDSAFSQLKRTGDCILTLVEGDVESASPQSRGDRHIASIQVGYQQDCHAMFHQMILLCKEVEEL